MKAVGVSFCMIPILLGGCSKTGVADRSAAELDQLSQEQARFDSRLRQLALDRLEYSDILRKQRALDRILNGQKSVETIARVKPSLVGWTGYILKADPSDPACS